MILMHVHMHLTLIDTQGQVQNPFLTNFIISMSLNYVQTIYTLEGKIVILTFENDKKKSIQF